MENLEKLEAVIKAQKEELQKNYSDKLASEIERLEKEYKEREKKMEDRITEKILASTPVITRDSLVNQKFEKISGNTKLTEKFNALFKGDARQIEIHKATNIEGTSNLGGYLVPQEEAVYLPEINEFGLLRKNATIFPMSRDKMNFPYTSVGLSAYNVAEANASTVSNYTFGQLQLDTGKYIAIAPMSTELIEDSYYNLDSIVMSTLNKQFSAAEDTVFNTRINSVGNSYGVTGTSSSSFTQAITGADSFVANVLSPLWGVLASQNVEYTNGAGYIMHPTIWATILKWSDTSRRPIVNMIDPINKTLWGDPVYLSNKFTNATTTTSGKVLIAYGNMKNAFLGDRVAMQVEKFREGTLGSDSMLEKDLIAYRGRARFDVQLVPDAFAVYRIG